LAVAFDTSTDMEVTRSRLLNTARPYLQVLSILGYIIILIQFKIQVFAQSKYFEIQNISEIYDE